jgi:hypothetical protein
MKAIQLVGGELDGLAFNVADGVTMIRLKREPGKPPAARGYAPGDAMQPEPLPADFLEYRASGRRDGEGREAFAFALAFRASEGGAAGLTSTSPATPPRAPSPGPGA